MTTTVETSRADLEAFVLEARDHSWHDLRDAIDRAVNGTWSMEASNHARRLVEACRLVGVGDYATAPWSLVIGGVYDAVLEAGGLEVPARDEAEWRQTVEDMAKWGIAEQMVPRYAATVAAIRTPRETSWIAGGDE